MPHHTRSIPRPILISIGLALLSTGFFPLAVADAGSQARGTPGFDRTPDPNAAIITLLQSADPRDQAWGAWFTGRDHLTQLAPLVQQVVTERVFGLSLHERAAVDVALDALIQMRQGLPPNTLKHVSESRPAQALILAAFATSDDVEIDEFLFETLRGKDYYRWFAAANVLLKRRTFGLASAIISDLRLTVRVSVTSDNSHGFSGSGSGEAWGIGCGGGGAAATGLPPWAQYRLGTAAQPGLVVMSTGPVPVYYQRIVAPAGSTPSVSSVHRPGPTADERLRYLGWLSGHSTADLPVRGIEYREIRLAVGAPLDPALDGVRAEILSRWSLVAEALVRAQALNKESATTELPTLDFVVNDSR